MSAYAVVVALFGLAMVSFNCYGDDYSQKTQKQSQAQNYSDSNGSSGDDAMSIIGNFNADSADCKQEESGGSVCAYQGHASFADKDAKLWAPTIEVYRDSNNKIVRTVAIARDGDLAHYHQQGGSSSIITATTIATADGVGDAAVKRGGGGSDSGLANGEMVDAHAETITIYPDRHMVVLQGNAFIARPRETITGAYIEYDTAKKMMVSKPQKGIGKELTTIVLQPSATKSVPKIATTAAAPLPARR